MKAQPEMWYRLYTLLLVLCFPIVLFTLLIKKRCRSGLRQRMGWVPPPGCAPHETALWVHAVSLGEVLTIVPFVTALHRRHPRVRIIVSTVTETGREAVERRLAGVATHCFFPLDYPWIVRRFLQSLNPVGLVVVETELWPNVLRAVAQRGIPSIIVNGRFSSRSFSGYQWIRPFMRHVLSTVSLGLLQSSRDRRRFIELGASPDRMHGTGNMKCDYVVNGVSEPSVTRSALGISEDEMLIVAGSTHHPEEAVLLQSYRTMARALPKVILLLAPRHVERSDGLTQTIQQFGFPVVRRSRLPENGSPAETAVGPRVILLDTRGELAQAYGLAVLAFVGGTLAPVGGHNLLEPAAWGTPVCFGPYTDHCQDVADALIEAGGGVRVRNGEEVTGTLMKGIQDREWVSRAGRQARKLVDDNRGVVEKNLNMMEELINFHPTRSRRLEREEK